MRCDEQPQGPACVFQGIAQRHVSLPDCHSATTVARPHAPRRLQPEAGLMQRTRDTGTGADNKGRGLAAPPQSVARAGTRAFRLASLRPGCRVPRTVPEDLATPMKTPSAACRAQPVTITGRATHPTSQGAAPRCLARSGEATCALSHLLQKATPAKPCRPAARGCGTAHVAWHRCCKRGLTATWQEVDRSRQASPAINAGSALI